MKYICNKCSRKLHFPQLSQSTFPCTRNSMVWFRCNRFDKRQMLHNFDATMHTNMCALTIWPLLSCLVHMHAVRIIDLRYLFRELPTGKMFAFIRCYSAEIGRNVRFENSKKMHVKFEEKKLGKSAIVNWWNEIWIVPTIRQCCTWLIRLHGKLKRRKIIWNAPFKSVCLYNANKLVYHW